MKQYISYFDFLGYKKFILNNDEKQIKKRINEFLLNLELSLSQGKTIQNPNNFFCADLKDYKLNCLNFSDTIIFWTKDNSFDSFKEILNVSYRFNWSFIDEIPARGVIVFDEIDLIYGKHTNESRGSFNINSIFGKGLVNAHIKAECLDFAGCVIDSSVIDEIVKYEARFIFFRKKGRKVKFKIKLDNDTYSVEDFSDAFSILDDIGNYIKKHGLIKSFKSGELQVFRARQHPQSVSVNNFENLGSPPINNTQSNRMSPAGIPMFYGALDENTAIIEIIDFGKVTDIITTGKFINIQNLNLIDFSNLRNDISIFDEENHNLRKSFIFLRNFVRDLSTPISNDGSQHIEYVPNTSCY